MKSISNKKERQNYHRILSVILGASIAGICSTSHVAADSLQPVTDTGEVHISSMEATQTEGDPFIGAGSDPAGEGAEGIGELSAEDLAAMRALKGMAPANMEREQVAESIIGFDVRTRNYTTYYPARAVVRITLAGGGCTGFMIGDDTVATAGHCVAPGDGSGFYDRTTYRIYPGFDGTRAPYGFCTARRLYSVVGWVDNGDPRFDIGAIKLNCTVGNTVGWFGFRANAGNNEPMIVTGYPDDKSNQQWQSSDKVRRAETRRIYYSNDTRPGNSGGPVWQDWWRTNNTSAGPYAIGIHAYGVGGSGASAIYNSGTRLTSTYVNLLIDWRDAP